MRRVVYSVAMSMDGFIAGPNGEYDWITIDPDIDFSAIYEQFDTLLMGRRTWEVTRAQSEQGEAPEMPGVRSYVISRSLTPEDCPGAVVSADPAATVAELRAADGKDIWLFGGGSLFASLLELGLVDGVEVAVIPVILGEGIPLLPARLMTKLKLTEHAVFEKTGTVVLKYAVAKD